MAKYQDIHLELSIDSDVVEECGEKSVAEVAVEIQRLLHQSHIGFKLHGVRVETFPELGSDELDLEEGDEWKLGL